MFIRVFVLACLVACGGSSEKPSKGKDSVVDTTPQTEDTGYLITSDTGTSIIDTTPILEFDTGGPDCAGTSGDTTPIVDIPIDILCSVSTVPRGTPGVTIDVDDIAFATVIGEEGETLGVFIQPLGDQDHDGYGEVAISSVGTIPLYGSTTVGEIWVFPGPSLNGDLYEEDAASVLIGGGDVWGDGSYMALGDITGDGRKNLASSGRGGGMLPMCLIFRYHWE